MPTWILYPIGSQRYLPGAAFERLRTLFKVYANDDGSIQLTGAAPAAMDFFKNTEPYVESIRNQVLTANKVKP